MSEGKWTAIDAWDPLSSESDPGMLVAAQRREIRNILKSYTGYYDLFSELIQNALDAVERRLLEKADNFQPHIWIRIDLAKSEVAVTDNGCGMSESEFRQFLRPNFSFKHADTTRGSKGVGATYLAYGFNHVEVAARSDGKTFSGVMRRGREWVEDRTDSVPRPKVEYAPPSHAAFGQIDRGASMKVRLVGAGIRPRDLSWIGAQTADQWLAVLRTFTPLGGVYLCGEASPMVCTTLEVESITGQVTTAELEAPRYLHPAEVMNRVADIRDFLADRKARVDKGLDVSRIPPKFRSLHGIWGEWTGDQILDPKGDSPITARLESNEAKLVSELGLKLRIFLGFSTDLWDGYNDNTLRLRKGHRLLRGGLQLSTRHMPQGLPLTIPMTNNIGFQNLAHVLVHLENAEPDLGRKGFQPEVVRVAEKLSVSAVTALRRHYALLRKPGGAKAYEDELILDNWKQAQVEHEMKFPLVITGAGLFMPTEELPIRSEPVVEQDVVALFNQMLSSGIVRGIQLISSSQYKQYDGLYRVKMLKPFEKFILSTKNPLGIDGEHFLDKETLETVVKVLEYKYTIDGLIEEVQAEVKAVEDVDLVIAWELGEKWRQMFEVTSYLDRDHIHLRSMHGATHSFTHAMNGNHAFEAIVLKDLVSYLQDPDAEEQRQRVKLSFEE
jgi:Histidine kinase-, DNA gyrase B-, and HSP90-like ATPase